MNNTNSTNHSKQLRTWAKIINDCKAAKASGTTVKDWLKANNISHDTYYYWYAEVKKAYVNDSLPHLIPFTIGRKNYLFCESVNGVKASAIIYSIVETAKANGLNVYKYLEFLIIEC